MAQVKSSLSREEKEILVRAYFLDPVKFCRNVLPQQFSQDVPWVHRGILAIFTRKTDFLIKYGELEKIIRHFTWKENYEDDESEEHCLFHIELKTGGYWNPWNGESLDYSNIHAIHLDVTKCTELVMPRGSSKTTLVGLAIMLYKVLYGLKKFIVYVSETATAAELQMDAVKGELESNELIKELFGNIVPERNSNLKWTAGFFETTTGITVTCRGRGGQIRGLNVGGQRPDEVICDDLENEESVKTDEQRLKTREWFYKALLPCLDQMDDTATVTILGTVLHNEALLMTLRDDPDWTSMVFGATDRDGDALWELYMNLDKIERTKQAYARNGMLAAFYMEYESQLRPDEGAKFRSSFFIIDPLILQELDATAQVIDPAISDDPSADFCGIVNAGITTKGFGVVMDTWVKRGAEPREQVDVYFEKSRLHKPTRHGVESIAYQKALVFLLREEMARQNYFFVIDEIKHGKTGKDERILGVLQPRYANLYMRHTRKFPELESQLLDYPRGKKDLPDALAMAMTLLAPYAGNAMDIEIFEEEEKLEPLHIAMGGEWRAY